MLLNDVVIINADGPATGQCALRTNGDRIVEIAPQLRPRLGELVFDLRGRYLTAGLIDAHVHVVDYMAERYGSYWASPYYVAARAQAILRDMLDRGFTTVRDAGGADAGLAKAIEEGYIEGPRLIPSGRPISQTGGHGDLRLGEEALSREEHPLMGVIADGVAAVQAAARDELRRGAKQIKMMISGGVDSPRDVATSSQYSVPEIAAAVAEASAQNTYVMAHAYTSRSIQNGVEAGIRSIEHGNFLDDAAAERMAQRGVFLVPTLIVYQSMCTSATRVNAPAPTVSFEDMLAAGLRSLEVAKRAAVNVVFGTDLMGGAHHLQSQEFRLRSEVFSRQEVLRSATVTAAQLLKMPDELGTVKVGAIADLLVFKRNPLKDINALVEPERYLNMVIKQGRVVRPRAGPA